MTSSYRLIGSEMSPYSMKVRTYMQYKKIPFEWIERDMRSNSEFKKNAKVALVPLLICPDGSVIQDSTKIIEELEKKYPELSIYPTDTDTQFISALIEEFGDEWGNKLMFFFRWDKADDMASAAKRLTKLMFEPVWWGKLASPLIRKALVKRMGPRVSFVGGSDANRPHLMKSFETLVADLDKHLAKRPYLFGKRPSFGDFGLWGQLHQAYTDPTAGKIIKAKGPNLITWIERMLDPVNLGEFEPMANLRETLEPILANNVGARFLAWSTANEKAWGAKEKETSVEFEEGLYTQKTFKFHATTLKALKEKYQQVANEEQVNNLLKEVNCLQYFVAH